MSKNVAVFIDVANLYYAARGQDVDVDYVALLKHATKGRDLIRAYAYSGLDPENENQRKFLDFLSKNGYKVVHKDIRKFGDGRVKANLDIELVVDLFRLAPRMDIAVVISGDGDFASAIRALQDIGVRCEVISFRPNTSSDLIAVADEFTDIMKIIGIGRKKGEKGISMPEMPAKEVNPEFGFREASRGVAAAALAALREGEKPAGRSRRGRGASKPAEEVTASASVPDETATEMAAEPVEPMTAVEAHVEGTNGEPTRRRRRRRGGRGRGRGRRADAQEEPTAVASDGSGDGEGADIGWQEFDDLSQLGLSELGEPGGEREYAFEEADPQTLAELGLEPETSFDSTASEAAQAESQPQAAAPRRASRSRRSPRPSAPSQEPPSAEAPSSDGPLEAPSSDSPAEGKAPARRSRSGARATTQRGKAADAAPTAKAGRSARPRTRAAGRAQSTTDEGTNAAASATGRLSAARRGSRGGAGSRGSRSATGGALKAETGSEASPPTGQSESTGAEEGIWQRFRSGRRTTRSSS